MKNNKVFFRVDGSTQIGLGHLIRCLALAYMLKNRFQIFFVSIEIPEQIISEIIGGDFTLIKIQYPDDFFTLINDKDIVVMDGYQFSVEYQKGVKKTGSKLVCIDDLHEVEFVADLIINHTLAVTPHDYDAQPYTRFALGLNYVLLRPLFLGQAKKAQTIRGTDTILICFGGADPKNLTKQALEIILNAFAFKKVIVVTGAAYMFSESINSLIKSNSSVNHYSAISENEMLTIMLEADLAVVPSSGILLETLAAGCKIISGFYVDNQKVLYQKFKSIGAFVGADNFNKEDLETAIVASLKVEKTQSKLIDGNSDKNLLNCFYRLSASLRNAELSDCDTIFSWVNDSTVRSNAFNSQVIELTDHKTWFNKKLADENSHIFILYFQNINFGQIRFDIENKTATISYLIDKDFRGLGFGSLIVKKGIEKISEINRELTLIALVKPINEASIKVFQHLGFQQKEENHSHYGNIYSFSLEL